MGAQSILQQLDNELANLNQARTLLTGLNVSSVRKAVKKRTVSKQARRRMAIAQRARWAKVRRAA